MFLVRGARISAQGTVRILTLPGVVRPRSDTWLLADLLRGQTLPPHAAVLELCSGSGALAVSAARRGGCAVTAVDRSRRSVWTTRLNGLLNGVRVRACRGDLYDALRGERFDAIIANPATVADREGRALLDRICARAPAHLRPGGFLLLVQPVACGTDVTLDRLRAGGLEAAVVARRQEAGLLVVRARRPARAARPAEPDRVDALIS